MKKHLSSRFAVHSSAVVAASVLLSVVTPVGFAGTAIAQPVAASPSAAAATAEASPRIDSVKLVDTFTFGERVRIVAKITNPSGRPITGDQQTLVTFAHGKQSGGIIPADNSKIVLEQSTAHGIQRVPLGSAKDGSLQGLALIGKGEPIAPGATITENFYLTVARSVPAKVTRGEFSLGSDAEPTGRRSTGFAMKRDAVADKVAITGLSGTPTLVNGGEPVEFGVTVTQGSGESADRADFFLVSTGSADLDPQHVTVERRDASGKWVPLTTGEQDQSVTGNLDKGTLTAGQTRTYALRLGLTQHFSNSAKHGTFSVGSGEATASFGFDVRHRGGSTTTDPDVNRDLVIAVDGVQGVTPLKPGGAAKEFTATVTNKGNITQEPHMVLEITDQDVKRRMAAGEIRIEQYFPTARAWEPAPDLRRSTEGGHLMATVIPKLPTLAPGARATYKLRVAATSTMKAKAFHVDLEARAELSATRKSLAFSIGSGASQSPTPAASATPALVTGGTANGEMAQTGGGSSTPLLIGAAGVLVALGAGGLLIARRRAL